MQTSILTIQNELEKAKERLKGVEENIKKSIGRDINSGPLPQRPGFKRTARHLDNPSGPESPAVRPRFQTEGVKSRLGDFVRPGTGEEPRSRGEHDFRGRVNRRVQINDGLPLRVRKNDKGEERVPAKKRLGDPAPTITVFSRLSGPPKEEDEFEEKESPVKITSQVIVQDAPSRKEILAAQNGDNQSKARNRRIFGALLGTLQKFRQEENQLKEKEDKRAIVEKKLEDAALREKEELKKKRQELFSSRRQQQAEIRQLEYKLIRLKQLTEWETAKKHLLNFIQTKSSPKLFYLPKVLNDKNKELLEESQRNIQRMIEKKRREVEKAIADHAAARKGAKDIEEGDEENHEDMEVEGGGEEEPAGVERGENGTVESGGKCEDAESMVMIKKEKGDVVRVKEEQGDTLNGLDSKEDKENRVVKVEGEKTAIMTEDRNEESEGEEGTRRKRRRKRKHSSSSSDSSSSSSEDSDKEGDKSSDSDKEGDKSSDSEKGGDKPSNSDKEGNKSSDSDSVRIKKEKDT